MKIIGIVGSPRTGGNTEILVRDALEAAKESDAEVELIRLAGKRIEGCDGCGACMKTGECRIKDDMQEIYQKLLDADGIILASPTYWWSITAQCKALMDRTLCLWWGRKLKGKVGGSITNSWGTASTYTAQVINGWFLQHSMIIGGNYDAIVTGPSCWSWTMGTWPEVVPNVPEKLFGKDWIKEDKLTRDRARELGKTIVTLIKLIKR